MGSTASDTIVSTTASETLIGNGGADDLVFAPGYGLDTITDFTPGVDLVQFSTSMFATQQAILDATQNNVGGFAVITTSVGHDVTLNVNKAALDVADFRLV